MAITLVQSNEQITNATGSTTLAFGSNITAGNCVVVMTAAFGSSLNIHSDNNGGVYRTPPGCNFTGGGGIFMRLDVAPNHAAGATTVTIDPSGTADIYVVIMEFSGVDTLQPIDMSACGNNTGTSTSPTAGSTGTFYDAGERVTIGMVSHAGLDTGITEDSGNGWTLIQENEGGSANCPGAGAYKVTSATTAQTPAWTLGGSQNWSAVRAVLRADECPFPYLKFPVGSMSAFASGTTITTVIPSGDVTDDYMILAQMANGSTTFSTPTDWAILGTSVESNANQSSEFYEQIHDGSEADPASTTSATMSGTLGGYGRIWVFGGVDTSTPTEDVTMAGTPTSDNNPDTATIDTTDDFRLAFAIVLVDDDNTWSSGMPPAGWMNAGPITTSTTGGDCMMDAIMQEVPAAATVSAATIGTMSAADFWRSMTLALIPAAAGGDATATPAAISVATTIPAASPSAGSSVTPATTSIAITLPDPTDRGGAGVNPAAISVPVTIPQAALSAGSTVTPAAIPIAVTIPAATATGNQNATATPDPITVAVTIPQATPTAGSTVTPSAIPITVTIPAASATGSGEGAATPATITTTVTIPQATPSAGSTVTPSTIPISVTMPAATPGAGATTSPATIPITVTIPQATASGATAGTATPSAIAIVTTMPSPTLAYGSTVNPAAIQLAISIGAVIASGLLPDVNPVTVTLRDAGHTVTVRVFGNTTTARPDTSTTARENR